MPTQADSIVIGSGPAGSVCAMTLAAAGRSVILLERGRHPRYKACGGAVVERALAGLPCPRPTPDDLPMRAVRRLAVRPGPQGEPVPAGADPPVLMVMRSDFDAFLVRKAREAGAELREGAPVTELSRRGDSLICSTPVGRFEAPTGVGADGAESRTARFLGVEGRQLGVALEGELEEPPRGANGGYEAWFDFGQVPHGYGWIFPKAAGISAGVFTRHPRFPPLRANYREYLIAAGLDGARELRCTGHRIPVRPGRSFGRGPVLLAGDAAGLADPLTGEGISFAIRSGVLAGQAILQSASDPSRAAAVYRSLLGRELLPEIRAARMVAAILYAFPRASFRLFAGRERFARAVVDVFSGTRSYPELVRSVLRRPWRLLT